MDKRRIIGIIAIVIGLVGCFAKEQETNPGIYVYSIPENVFNLLQYTWLLLSLGTKIAMVFKKRWWILPFSSCISFVILSFVNIMFVHQIIPFETPIIYEVLVITWALSWICIDAFDAFVFQPFERNKVRKLNT